MKGLLDHVWTRVLIASAAAFLAGCTGTRAVREARSEQPPAGSSSALKPVAVAKGDIASAPRMSSLTQASSFQAPDAGSGSAIVQTSSTETSESLSSAPDDAPSVAADSSIQQLVATTAAEKPSDDPAASANDDPGENKPSQEYSLSLSNILQLADSQNPNVALARERINEAYARVQRSQTLWLPSLRAGLSYDHHEGAIQDVAGNVFQTNRSAFGGGFGTPMYGAFSPTYPGVSAQFHLADAIFQPKIAAHQEASRRFGATAVRNDTLRDASIAYLELVRAEHGVAIARFALEITQKLTELTRQYSETGQGLQSDHERMEAELAIRREQLLIQQEAQQLASARLAQLLHADPSVLIVSGEPAVTPLEVMSAEESAASHVALGLSRRPELCEQKELVQEAVERLNREKYAPLVPSVLLAMSYGGMGGGLGTSIANTGSRWDADAIAYWELRNLGMGDRAAQGETASAARQAQMREIALLDRVAREIVEAHTQVVQRQRRVELTKTGIVSAERSYHLNLQRIENAQGLPIEVLQSIQALAAAQRAYLNAVIDYNIAQFELCRATGWFVES